MYVACSTLCFARYPLERALRMRARRNRLQTRSSAAQDRAGAISRLGVFPRNQPVQLAGHASEIAGTRSLLKAPPSLSRVDRKARHIVGWRPSGWDCAGRRRTALPFRSRLSRLRGQG